MKGIYSHRWLQTFFDKPLPSPEEVSEGLLKHAFEIEDVRTSADGDTVYELDILSNRSTDCLAHYGIAKELSAIFSLPLKRRYFQEKFSFSNTAEYIQTEQCDRYTILKVENITLQETPKEIQQHLEAVGQRCIHPIVDLSNYILFDIGQPIHAFDARKVSGQFGVRQARADERLVLLGDEEMVLREDDIVITDADTDRAIALAGIKGGEETKVDETTKDIYLEIATFDNKSIRQTVRRTGYGSDASARFSQGFPPEMIDYTAHKVAEVFEQYSSITDSYDHQRVPLKKQWHTGVSISEVNNLLGTSYTQKDIANTFDRLGFSYEYINPRERFLEIAKKQVGKPYTWGASVSKDAPDKFDCSSFICWCAAQAGKSIPRMAINQYFYSDIMVMWHKYKLRKNLPQPGDLLFATPTTDTKTQSNSIYEDGFPIVPGKKSDIDTDHPFINKEVGRVGILTDQSDIYRFIFSGDQMGSITNISAVGKPNEMVTIAPIGDQNVVGFGRIWSDEKRFAVTIPIERPDIRDENDLIEEIGRMQGYDTVPSIAPTNNLWAKMRHWVSSGSNGNNEMFAKRLAVLQALQKIGFSEVMTSSFCNKGAVCVAYPVAKDKGCLRTSLRPGIEEALKQNAYNGELLGLDSIRITEIGSVFAKNGEIVHLALGMQETLGRKKSDTADTEKEIQRVLGISGGFENGVWEVPLDEVRMHGHGGTVSSIKGKQYTPPSKYPFVLRDVAMFVPSGTETATVEKILQEHGGTYLRQINLFDAFKKDGKQSYAFRLVFQSDTETLDDTTVNTQMDTIYQTLKQNNYEVR